MTFDQKDNRRSGTGGLPRRAALGCAVLRAIAAPALAQPPSDGRVLAKRDCAQCHAIGATGSSPMPRAPRFRDLSDIANMDQLITAIRQGLLNKHPAMPQLRLTPKEIDQLADYLKAIQVKKDT